MRIVQVSDIHLSATNLINQGNWDATLAYINRTMPDLVVVTGDMVLDDPDDELDLPYAAQQVSRLQPDWLAIAGNHDIGDTGIRPFCEQRVTEARLARFRGAFGRDWWRKDIGDWTFLGINDFLLDEPLASRDAQFQWLSSIAPSLATRNVAVFTHKPLFIQHEDETTESIYCISPRGRAMLRKHLDGIDVKFWAAGHTHNGRLVVANGELHVWAPTLAHINYDENFPFSGSKRAGIVEYDLNGEAAGVHFVEPAGVAINDVTGLFAQHSSFRFIPRSTGSPHLHSRVE